MPTAYTAELMEKGQDFRTFALRCARAFGACILQRDDPMHEPPKKQEPESYSAQRLAEATALLEKLNAMSDDERFDYGSRRKADSVTKAAEWLQNQKNENARVDGMMVQVVAWKPPSDEHAGLKAFMIEQLTTSRHDLSWARKTLDEATNKPLRDYYTDDRECARRDIEYHRKEVAKENERTGDRNEWIEQLYGSLGE